MIFKLLPIQGSAGHERLESCIVGEFMAAYNTAHFAMQFIDGIAAFGMTDDQHTARSEQARHFKHGTLLILKMGETAVTEYAGETAVRKWCRHDIRLKGVTRSGGLQARDSLLRFLNHERGNIDGNDRAGSGQLLCLDGDEHTSAAAYIQNAGRVSGQYGREQAPQPFTVSGADHGIPLGGEVIEKFAYGPGG